MKHPAVLLAKIVLAATALSTAGAAFSQAYPNRPVQLMVPFPAGAPVDSLARAFGVAAKGDPHIVYRLRKGKDVTASTMDLLSNYMRANPALTKKKRQTADYAVA